MNAASPVSLLIMCTPCAARNEPDEGYALRMMDKLRSSAIFAADGISRTDEHTKTDVGKRSITQLESTTNTPSDVS